MRDEFLKDTSSFFQTDGLTGITLVCFEVDIVECDLDEFSGSHRKTRKGFRPLTICQQGVDFMRGCTESFNLLEHVPDTTQHGDGAIEIFQKMFEVNHNVIHGLAELLFEPLLHRPASQTSHGSRRLGYLALKQGHDFRREQVAGCGSDVINRPLDHLQRSLHGSVEHGDRVAQAPSMFQALEHRAETLEGRVVVEEGLSERFFCESGSEPLCFLDVSEGFLVRLSEGGCFVDQRRQLCLGMPSSCAKVAEFT